MKRYLPLLFAGALSLPGLLVAQEPQPPAPPAPAPQPLPPQPSAFQDRLRSIVARASTPEPTNLNLTRFDLDFPGGSPEQLVQAISKASGRPLNAILPKGSEEVELPPLRMKSVTTPTLFEALRAASTKTVFVKTSTYDFGGLYNRPPRDQFVNRQVSYGFETRGTISDDSVWYFVDDNPTLPPEEPKRAYRFYQLAPYLETYKVEDITTAIQTGYKMLGERFPPTISFHQDTKLLIAVGQSDKLQLIDDVLKELSGSPKSGKESVSPPKIPAPIQPPKAPTQAE